MPMNHSHAVIILASGLSQRLGRSKQLLNKDHQPLIRHMLKLALKTKPKAIVILLPQEQPAIATAIKDLLTQNSSIYPVLNSKPEIGMAHSLSLGIEALANLATFNNNATMNRVLIMGIDQVLLDSQHLTRLLAGKHSIVASSYAPLNKDLSVDNTSSNIVGLPIVIDYALLKQWQSALTGDKGLRHLIRALSPEQISMVINNNLSYDIDTPEQLIYAQKQCWLDK